MINSTPCSCGCSEVRLSWCWFKDLTKHLEQSCAVCGAHRGWAPQTAENIALAGDPPAQPSRQKGLFA